VDTRQKRLSATAMGVPELRARSLQVKALTSDARTAIAAKSLNAEAAHIRHVASTPFLHVYHCEARERRFLGLFTDVTHPTRVVDAEGIVRLKLLDAMPIASTQSQILGDLSRAIEEQTTFGDAGGLPPDVFVLVSGRVIDLSGLASKEQTLTVLRAELERFSATETVVALVSEKS
jgi:N-methylhydantoinase A